MQIIKELVERIDDEIQGAKDYVLLAQRVKLEHPRIADKLVELAETEMQHAKILHGEATKAIEQVRARDGEPPAAMLAVYEYEHEKQVKCAAEVRQLITDYRDDA